MILRQLTGAALSLALVAAARRPRSRPTSGNWMRDFVTARVAAQNLRAIGDGGPGRSGEELMSLVRPSIVGGTTAGADGQPVPGRAVQGVEPNNASAQFCGGTLVRPNMVVTAAHCSDFVTAGQVQVLTGTRRLDGSGDRRNVAAIAIHPAWNSNTFDNDVAVWELDERGRRNPACHPRDRGRAGRRQPARHRLGNADRRRQQTDRPAPRHSAAGRHRQLQRRQLLQRRNPAAA